MYSKIRGGTRRSLSSFRKRKAGSINTVSSLISSRLRGVSNKTVAQKSPKKNTPWWINSKTGRKKSYNRMTRKQKRLHKKWQKRHNKKTDPDYRRMKLELERRLRAKELGNTGWNNTHFTDF